jgi:hypothetical protein
MLFRGLKLAVAATVLALLVGCGGGSKPVVTPQPAGPTLPPVATRVAITPTAVAGHATGTRTGIGVVDRAIAAVESGDEAQLLSVLSFHKYPCDGRQAAGSAPCPAGVSAGTEVDAVFFSRCDGLYLAKGTADLGSAVRNFMHESSGSKPVDPEVYAVTEVNPARFTSPLPFKYLIIFVSGHSLLVDDAGVTHIGSPCGEVGPADLFHPSDKVILAPV